MFSDGAEFDTAHNSGEMNMKPMQTTRESPDFSRGECQYKDI